MAQAIEAEAEEVAAVRAQTERKVVENNKKQEQSVRKEIERNLNTTEEIIKKNQPKAYEAEPATTATLEAGPKFYNYYSN
jgi:aminoglycoside phosphotransferase family enzyme